MAENGMNIQFHSINVSIYRALQHEKKGGRND